MTRGYLTTEFYVTLLGNVIAILALFKIGLPSDTSGLVQAAALLAAFIANAVYANARKGVKQAASAAMAADQVPVTVTTGSAT